MNQSAAILGALLLLITLAILTGELLAAPAALPDCSGGAQSIGTGSFVLGANTSAATNTDCYHLTADNITIDLQGFTISGSSSGCGCLGIFDTGSHTNIVIRNGTVRNFANGVSLANSTRVVVENMLVTGNSRGVQVGTNSTIRNSTISNNSFNGIEAVSNETISGNTINNNAGEGISITGVNNLISGNTVDGNSSKGIDAGGTDNFIIGNIVNGNESTGINAGSGAALVNNIANDNTIGITVVCPANLTGNTALSNSTANFTFSGKCGKGTGNIFK